MADEKIKLPGWLDQREMVLLERLEIQYHKVMSLFPVTLSFGLFLHLTVFYGYFYLWPTIEMDFSRIGFKSRWHEDEADAKRDSYVALHYLLVFSCLTLNLLCSLIRTISTGPGSIPDDCLWDIPDDEINEPEIGKLTNKSLDEGKKNPVTSLQRTYKYLSAPEGSLIVSKDI